MSIIKKLISAVIKALRSSIPVLLTLTVITLLVLLWWLGPKWQYGDGYPLESLTVRWSITMGLFVVLAIAAVIAMYRRNRALQQEMKKEEEEKADPIKPILLAMRHQYERVLQELRLNIGKRNYVYTLPWYMVIGAENSGKTSLINRSGQNYIQTHYNKSKRAKYENLPYKIDWWISDEAVLIDPDGELISGNPKADFEGEDQQIRELPHRVWNDFVAWLEKSRPRRPLNGIVLVVDLVSIMNMQPSDRKSYAILLRNRLRELIENLGTRLPVYVVMSKFDLLDGFEDFFGQLPPAEREKPFGFALSADNKSDTSAWLDELQLQYEAFVDNLASKTFDALASAPDQKSRNALFSFNRQLVGVKETLLDFFEEVLDQDRYSTPALVRGVYFTSVYQQGIPHNTFVQAAAASYELPARIEAAKSIKRSVTYFSQSLFQKVIYPEAGLAGDNIRMMRQKKRTLIFNGVLATLIGVLVIGGWHHYYIVNTDAAAGVVKESQQFEALRAESQRLSNGQKWRVDITGHDMLKPLNQIYNAIALFDNYREKPQIIADMGLYQGHAIGPKVEETYLNLLQTRFLPQLAVGLLESINNAEDGSNEKLSALRVYRIMQDIGSRTEGDKQSNERHKQIVQSWMETKWQDDEYNISGTEQKELMAHLNYAMNLVSADIPAFFSLASREEVSDDQITRLYLLRYADDIVTDAQKDLRQLSTAHRLYESIKQDAQVELRNDINIRQFIGSEFDVLYKNEQDIEYILQQSSDAPESAGSFITDVDSPKESLSAFMVPALYTAPAYRNYFIQRSENILDLAIVDEWVIGKKQTSSYSEADKKQLAKEIRTLYISDYTEYWKRALREMEIREFADIEYAVQTLDILSGSSEPIQCLLGMLKDNVDIYPDLKVEEGVALTEAEKTLLASEHWRGADGIRRNFNRLTGLLEQTSDDDGSLYETLTVALSNAYDYMAAIQNAPDRGKAALKATRSRFELDGTDPLYVLTRISDGLPEPLSAHIAKVASESWQVMLVKALQELEKRWDEEVYSFYQERLSSRYPFNPNSPIDTSLEDFELMFGPQGKLQQFYDEYLKLFLHDNLNALYSQDDESYLVRIDVLEQLEAAWQIQNGFFDSRGGLSVDFSLEPLALSANKLRSVIDIDGQRVSYNHGPTHSSRLIWPNTLRDSAQTQLTIIDTSGNGKAFRYRGPWSWFRLLEKARINGVSDNMVDITLTLGNGSMRYRVRSEKSNSPLINQLFENFSLPRTLLQSKNPVKSISIR